MNTPPVRKLPGIDLNQGIRYAGENEELYMRFLKRFPDDENMGELCAALASGDMDTAFVCAHTLKGLALQLGITALCEPAAVLCDLLRARDSELLPRARAQAAKLDAQYAQIVRTIRGM